jgi:hypothetical protein
MLLRHGDTLTIRNVNSPADSVVAKKSDDCETPTEKGAREGETRGAATKDKQKLDGSSETPEHHHHHHYSPLERRSGFRAMM